MQTSQRHDQTTAAYRRECELLTVRRIPLSVALYLMFIATSGALEYHYYPERVFYFGVFLSGQAAVCAALLLLRRWLLRRHLATSGAVLAAGTLASLMIGYVYVIGADSNTLATALCCLLAGLPLLLPWGVRGQLQVALTVLLGFGLNVLANPPAAVPPLYQFFAVFSGGFISVLGAYYLDLQRYAIFRESMLKDEAAKVNRALLRIGGELNSSLEAGTVLERIARSACETLACDWSMILLWDARREVFRVAAGVSSVAHLLEEAREMEFSPERFPLVRRLLGSEDLIEVSAAHPPDEATAAMLAHFETRAMLAAALVRGGRVVGVMAGGRTHASAAFLPRELHLTRGIAQQAAVALENARLVADLRQADRMKSEFVATMSHELRTPLNIIIGYNDLLTEGAFGTLTAEQHDIVERVRQNSIDLLTLINATLDVNRLEAGRLPIDVEEIRLADLLAEIQTEVERFPRADGVRLEWRVAVDSVLRSDPKKIRIILRNLISNALKFTDHGHVAVAVNHPADGPVEFSVSDTGIGIPAPELPNIFGMFRQVSNEERHTGGVGLGLYIVQRFVSQLRGEINVRSTLGTGTTFTVRIPHLAAERQAA